MNLIENVVWFTPKNAFTKELTWLPALFIHAFWIPENSLLIFSALTKDEILYNILSCPSVYRQRLMLP